MVCDERGIGGIGEYCGENDAHLDCISVFYHEASSGKYAPRAVLLDLEPGVISAVTLSRRSANFQPGQPREPYARAKTGPKTSTKGLNINSSDPFSL
jgi:hypothetical protein